MSYFESSFGIVNFEIRTAIGNQASERIAEDLGFDLIKIQEKGEKLHGDWVDHKIYANKTVDGSAEQPVMFRA